MIIIKVFFRLYVDGCCMEDRVAAAVVHKSKSLSRFKVDLDLVYSILKDYTSLANNGKIIVFCSILSHVNVRSNKLMLKKSLHSRCSLQV